MRYTMMKATIGLPPTTQMRYQLDALMQQYFPQGCCYLFGQGLWQGRTESCIRLYVAYPEGHGQAQVVENLVRLGHALQQQTILVEWEYTGVEFLNVEEHYRALQELGASA